MRPGALSPLLLAAILFAGCTKPAADDTTSTAKTSTASATRDDRSMAEKAGDAGLRARTKAEELKRAEDAKAKETDATNE